MLALTKVNALPDKPKQQERKRRRREVGGSYSSDECG